MYAFVTAVPVGCGSSKTCAPPAQTRIHSRQGAVWTPASRVRPAWHMTASTTTDTTSTDTESVSDWPSAKDISSGATELPVPVYDVEAVMKILPHRFPFLLLDRVIAFESGKRAIGIKSVTINEPFFPGHFPNRPIMPGVLQVEALAQLGGIVMLQPPFVEKDASDIDFFFGGIDKVKWRKPVVPGDTLVMEMTLSSFKKSFGIAKMDGRYVLVHRFPSSLYDSIYYNTY